MLNGDVKSVVQRGDHLFGNRGNMLSFWQDAADNFFPERAAFTASPSIGTDFAAHLYTSYPIMVRRELSGAFASMLRRRDLQWGHITVDRADRLDGGGRAFLKQATDVQWRAMYDKKAKLVRATKEGDDDFACFGQTVITREINMATVNLVYQCWHLADCAWAEDANGDVNELHINWNPTIDQLVEKFGEDALHHEVRKRKDSERFGKIRCRRVVLPSFHYAADAPGEGKPRPPHRRQPYTVLFIDLENQHVMREYGRHNKGFTLPRWQTVSGSPIAYSPAVIAALPDARLIQAMTLTILEAGEGAVRPPLLGKQDAIRGDAQLYPGGITWAQLENDDELENVLREVYTSTGRSLPITLEMNQDIRNQIAAAFFLNKLTLPNPERAGKMTAFEIAERLKEWIRAAIPLFEPVETEYNADLCEGTFEDLEMLGAFGPRSEYPESVTQSEVQFRFEGPLHENIERQKAHAFVEARQLVMDTVDLDPASVATLDVREALRTALLAVGVDPKHVRDREDVEEFAQQLQASKQAQELAAAAEGAGLAAEAMGKGRQAIAAAEAA